MTTVSAYMTSTGRRVDAYCRTCGVTAIMDYKTDHHEDGSKESYKECRNCGTKVTVTKRMTKQKQARAAKQEELNTLMHELLNKAVPEAAQAGSDLLKKSQMSLDFSQPHHVAYERVSPSGMVSHIRAKGAPTAKPAPAYHAHATVEKMAQLISDNNFDYNEFEATEGTCDACGKDSDIIRSAHDADNAGNTLYGQVCEDCLAEAYRKANDTMTRPPKLQLPSAYPKTKDGWKQYMSQIMDRESSSSAEEKRTGSYNKHMVFDFDDAITNPKFRDAWREMTATRNYFDAYIERPDGGTTIEMWASSQGEMERLRREIIEEEQNGNRVLGRKLDSAYMAAYDNAGDSLAEQDLHPELYGNDPSNNPKYHSLAYGSLSMTSAFEENQDVQEWYQRHGYSW